MELKVGRKFNQHYGKMFTKNRFKSYLTGGFTLFELLVVIAIVAIVTAVSFSGFPKMNSKLSLDLLTQDIALTLRQAQVFGTTVMGTGANTENFESYGVSFPDPNFEPAKENGKYRYVIYADLSPLNDSSGNLIDPARQNFYNEVRNICMNDYSKCMPSVTVSCGSPSINTSGGENECLQSFLVGGVDKITSLCINYINNDTVSLSKEQKISVCNDDSDNRILRPEDNASVDITYRRPKLKAEIRTKYGGDICSNFYCNIPYGHSADVINNIGIVITSESGETRAVVAWANGQISIDK